MKIKKWLKKARWWQIGLPPLLLGGFGYGVYRATRQEADPDMTGEVVGVPIFDRFTLPDMELAITAEADDGKSLVNSYTATLLRLGDQAKAALADLGGEPVPPSVEEQKQQMRELIQTYYDLTAEQEADWGAKIQTPSASVAEVIAKLGGVGIKVTSGEISLLSLPDPTLVKWQQVWEDYSHRVATTILEWQAGDMEGAQDLMLDSAADTRSKIAGRILDAKGSRNADELAGHIEAIRQLEDELVSFEEFLGELASG